MGCWPLTTDSTPSPIQVLHTDRTLRLHGTRKRRKPYSQYQSMLCVDLSDRLQLTSFRVLGNGRLDLALVDGRRVLARKRLPIPTRREHAL
jgi:hypothetical protein